MILWVAIAGLTALALVFLALPFVRAGRTAASREAYDLAVYRAQLRELEHDVEEGLIAPEAAESAKAEIARRALRAADAEGSGEGPSGAAGGGALRGRWWVAVALVLLLPALSVLLYHRLGSPGLPAAPFAGAETEGEGAEDLAEFEAVIARLEERMRATPERADGWRLLGRSYMTIGRFGEAADRFRRALDLLPGDPEIAAEYGEALVFAEDGMVTPEARSAFLGALSRKPQQANARYYLGLARLQAGDPRDALRLWQELVDDAPEDSPWLPGLRATVARLRNALGADPSGGPPVAGEGGGAPAPANRLPP